MKCNNVKSNYLSHENKSSSTVYTQSQHYAGVAFDVGQTLSPAQRTRLWNSANNSGVWYYVEPISLTPTWVHFDKRFR